MHVEERVSGNALHNEYWSQMSVPMSDKKQGPNIHFRWLTCCHVPVKPGGWYTCEGRCPEAGRLLRLGTRLRILLGMGLYVDVALQSLLNSFISLVCSTWLLSVRQSEVLT